MFAILTPVLSTPIILILSIGTRPLEAPPDAELSGIEEKSSNVAPADVPLTFQHKAIRLFWSIDVIGLGLLVVGAGLVLITVTIANGSGSRWGDGESLAYIPTRSG